jgi:hypothetical protein
MPDATANGRPLIDAGMAHAFLGALWGDAPDGYLLLWVRQGKRSLWFPAHDLDAVSRGAASLAATKDVYLGCALSPTDNGGARRCEAAEALAIPGVWADVDVAGEAHKKAALAHPERALARLLKRLGRGYGVKCLAVRPADVPAPALGATPAPPPGEKPAPGPARGRRMY